jgi:hypothetical protein
MIYAEKLKDPRWQKKRLEILSRDEFTCQLCNDKDSTLHVHHNKYGSNPWDIENDKLITYCEHCHRFVEITKNFKDYNIIKIIKKKSNEEVLLYSFVIDELNHKWIVISLLNMEIHDDIKFISLLDEKLINDLNNLINNN